MAKYTKRPVTIEAEQFRQCKIFPRGVCLCGPDDTAPHVHTMHAHQLVYLEYGDWVVTEPDGVHFYPVKDEVFRANYTNEYGSDIEAAK